MDFSPLLTQLPEWIGAAGLIWLLSISPQFRREPLGFKYARRDGIMALTLGGVALVFAYTARSFAASLPQWFSGPAAAFQTPFLTALAALLPVLAALLIRGQPPRSAGWGRAVLKNGWQAGLALALLTVFLRNRVMDLLAGISTAEFNTLLVILATVLAEETLFRGAIQQRLGWWLGQNRGWAITTLLFAAWRVLMLPAAPFVQTAVVFLIALAQGGVAGWAMRRAGHVVAPALYRAVSLWLGIFA